MANHAYVRISGPGFRFLPVTPYRVQAVGPRLDVVVEVAGVERSTSIDSEHPRGDHAVGAVVDGAALDRWIVEVGGVYAVDWPTELALQSWPESDRPPFYMFTDGAGSLVHAQGPFDASAVPPFDAMIYEGQRELSRDDSGDYPRIDLAYDHEGTAWIQRHIVLPLPPDRAMVVSVQAKEPVATAMLSLGLAVAQSIRPFADD